MGFADWAGMRVEVHSKEGVMSFGAGPAALRLRRHGRGAAFEARYSVMPAVGAPPSGDVFGGAPKRQKKEQQQAEPAPPSAAGDVFGGAPTRKRNRRPSAWWTP